jgi:hypothetical protein
MPVDADDAPSLLKLLTSLTASIVGFSSLLRG